MKPYCLLAGLVLLAGCGDTGPPQADNAASPSQPDVAPTATESTETSNTAAVTATVKTAEELDQLIASFRGKFVVMDLWAMW